MTAIKVFKFAVRIIDHLRLGYHHTDSGYITDSLCGNYSYKIVTMGFNNYGGSSYGSYAYNRYKASHTGQEFAGYATANNVFHGSLDLEIENISKNQIVKIGTVRHGYLLTYKVPVSGKSDEYRLKFSSTTEKKSWNLGWRFRHYYADFTGQMPYALKSPNIQMNYNNSFNENIQSEVIDNRLLRKSLVERNLIQKSLKPSLSFSEFSDQFYDEYNDFYLDYAHDYSAGDYMILKDKIVEAKYLSSENITSLGFINGNELDYITFKGDITDEYKVGDFITLQFKLLPINNTDYVELDYNVDYYENEGPPNIKNYVVDF